MNIAALHRTATALPLIAMLALAGCGGGGGGSTAGGPQTPGVGPGGGTPPEPLTPATGLNIGEPDTSTGATTLSSTLYRDTDTNRSSIMEGFHVASLSSDGSGEYGTGGYRVTYVIDGTEESVDFGSSDFGADTGDPNSYYKQLANGHEFWLESLPDNKSWAGDHYAQYRFIKGLPGSILSFMTDGTRTEANNFPSGSATYIGDMTGEMFDNTVGTLAWNQSRSRIAGYLALTASFANASIDGRIFRLRLQAPGASSYTDVSSTSRFDIDNGRLNDKGQFAAELTGVEDDPTIPGEDSVNGFEGDILGEFYGPDSAEVAGVLNAKRVGNGLDQELIGRFGGSKAVGTEAIVTGVNRLFDQGQTVAIADDGMAAVERTAGGWTVTIDGHTVEFSDSDFNAHPELSDRYYTNPANDRYSSLSSSTRGFRGNKEFDHFDVKRWAYGEIVAGADLATIETTDFVSSKFLYALHGNRTPEGSMPTTTTASYDGRMFAYSWPSDDAVFGSEADRYTAKIALTADFANASVAGEVRELRSRPASSNSYTPVAGGATFSATISANLLSADNLVGTGAWAGFQNGSVEGAFFGPAADEVGGVLDAADAANNRLLMGYFGADKE